jgi:hypothetical protein
MGSYGDTWLQCAYCGKWGKNLDEDGVEPLWDVDPVGPLCDPCYVRGQPPHLRKYSRLFSRLPKKVVANILEFAFQVCYENGSGYPYPSFHGPG